MKKLPPKEINDKEKALWRSVTKDIRPLKKPAANSLKAETGKKDTLKKITTKPKKTAVLAEPMITLKPAEISKNTAHKSSFQTDKRTHNKLKKGRMEIEASLDLHGLSIAQAHTAFQKFVVLHIKKQSRLLLIITGKGKDGAGVLRKEIHHWIHESYCAHSILKMLNAAPHDGGTGAYYLFLRRKR